MGLDGETRLGSLVGQVAPVLLVMEVHKVCYGLLACRVSALVVVYIAQDNL